MAYKNPKDKYAWERRNIQRILAKRRMKRNTVEGKLRQREGHLKRKYGLTLETYQEMLQAQNGVCSICGKPPYGKGIEDLDVDHSHETGKVRKLLCRRCNQAIGLLDENPDRLRAAAIYLESF